MGKHQMVYSPGEGAVSLLKQKPQDHQRPASVQGSINCHSDHITTSWRVGSKSIPAPAEDRRQVANAMGTQVDGLGPIETFDQGAFSIHTPTPERYSPASSKYPDCEVQTFSAREAKELLPAHGPVLDNLPCPCALHSTATLLISYSSQGPNPSQS